MPYAKQNWVDGVTPVDAAHMNYIEAGIAAAAALGAGKVKLVGGNLTTSSLTFVDVTGATITITTGANRVLLAFSGVVANGQTGNGQYFTFLVDGVDQGGSQGLIEIDCPGNGYSSPAVLTYLTDVLVAGPHTFKAQWRVSAGTSTLQAGATNPVVFSAVELSAPA
jgi:hypothetical protein